MTTSWPIIRFGIDAGMSAPWTRPRVKPAGLLPRLSCWPTRLRVQPMANAQRRIAARRVSGVQRARGAAATLTVLADIWPSMFLIFATRQEDFGSHQATRHSVAQHARGRNWFAPPALPILTAPVIDEPFLPTIGILKLRGEAQRAFHEKAARAASARFGRRVFLRGVVEVSNFCRENCSYCGMRRDNHNLARCRARLEELAELLVH